MGTTGEYHLLIKPASADCNAACDYCFYLRTSALYPQGPHRMSEEVLRRFIPPFLAERHSVSVFCWQGGEPTLMGLPFFKTVVRLQQEYGASGQVVGNALQTNGILIDEEWAEFLAEYRFLVGLSIDGPEDVHDAHRRTAAGRGTWRAAMHTADLLRRYNVAFNILTVVSDVVAENGRRVYRWLVSEGFRHLQFIPCAEVTEDGRLAPWAVPAEAYGRFLCEVFDEWTRDGYPDVSIRTFDHLVAVACGMKPQVCTFGPSCDGHLVIEHNGDIYPCDFFVRPEMKLGNVMENDIRQVARSARRAEFSRGKLAAADACSGCEWWDVCYGGCQKDRLAQAAIAPPAAASPIHSRTLYCAAYKRLFAHSRAWLEKTAKGLHIA